jgi:aconitate hydratase
LLGLTGRELFEISGIARGLKPMGTVMVKAVGDKTVEFAARVRIDTPEELEAFRNGGILPYVLRQLVGKR